MKIIYLLLAGILLFASIPPATMSEADKVIRQLKSTGNDSIRMQLIIQLAGFTDRELPEAKRRPLIKLLLKWYRNNPHPGVHSAIDYLLRYGRQGKTPRKLDWQQAVALAEIDLDLAAKAAGEKRWYVSGQGHTMAIIPGPLQFTMGSPLTEEGRSDDELLHTVRIPRSFAICTKELTVAQFQRFLEAHPEVRQRNTEKTKEYWRGSVIMNRISPDDDGPQIIANWYELAQYCNWLSEQENIPTGQWCYPTIDEIKSGMVLPSDYLHRTGYRLPTEAEWEFACRAGTTTSRFYGSDTNQLKEYAWYTTNSNNIRTWPVGQLKPNPLGLFDVYGNVWEWCHDRRQDYKAGITEDREDSILLVTDSVARTRRGGSFIYDTNNARSANRGVAGYLPRQRRDNVGLRVARTIRNF